MKWPTKGEDITKIKPLAVVLEKYAPLEKEINVKKIAEWCIARYKPDPAMVSLNSNMDDADAKAMAECGIEAGSREELAITGDTSFVANMTSDLLMALGGGEWAHYCAGLVTLRNAYTEAMSAMSETDEDKRAAVMLKKVELLTKVRPLMVSLDEYATKHFNGKDAPVQKGGIHQFIKAAPGTEKNSMKDEDE